MLVGGVRLSFGRGSPSYSPFSGAKSNNALAGLGPTDTESMAAASDLEPINLRIRRRTRLAPLSFLVLSPAVLWIAGLASSDRRRSELLGVAVLLTLYAIITVSAWMFASKKGRWLRLDDEGVTLHGHRIPWEAVMSAQWRSDAMAHRIPGIVLRLRPADGYEPPRTASVSIDPTLYGIAGIELLEMIVQYARPHTVYVLPPRHGPDLGI